MSSWSRGITGRRSLAWLAILLAVLWTGSPVSAEDSAPSASVAQAPGFDPAELEGADAKVGALAAHRLLQVISSREPKDEVARGEHLKYLLDRLQASRLARAYLDFAAEATEKDSRAIVSAERIVDALGTWTTSSGPPFPQTAEVVAPLLGVGSPVFRSSVIRALRAVILAELKVARRRDLEANPAGPGSPTLSSLASRFSENPPPPESFFRDACVVYWETEAKDLLGTLLNVLQLQAGAPAGSPGAKMAWWCVEELEARVSIHFPSLEAWQKWWGEVKGLSLERIVADAQRRSREESLQVWRQLIRRLRETGDAERLLLAILDTIDQGFVLELRVAAVAALGDFAEWVVDMPSSRNASASTSSETKDRWLARCVERLCLLGEARGIPPERPEVLRAALNALGKHHAYLERTPQLLARMSRLVGERLQELAFERTPRHVAELAEVLRLAGALRIVSAVGLVQSLLREPKSLGDEDLELVSAAVACLGRLSEKGLTAEDMAIVLAQFRRPRNSPEKPLRELRRACVTALGSGSEVATVRGELLAFFKEVLGGASPGAAAAGGRGEKELRIPAILGLGTLARQKDAGAYEALVAVLLEQNQFEPQEVAAAVDSLAYLGGPPVVNALVRCLVEAKDRGLEDHVRKKLLSLIEAGGNPVLLWVLEALEAQALAVGELRALEYAAGLAEAPAVKELLAADRQDLTLEGRLESFWKTSLAMAHAHDAVGKVEEARAILAQLAQALEKVPVAREKTTDGLMQLQVFRQVLDDRQALRVKLAKVEPPEVAMLLKELEALVLRDASTSGRWHSLRWVWRELAAPPMERLEKVRMAWKTFLAADSARPIWEGFPADFRERYLLRLETTPASSPEAK